MISVVVYAQRPDRTARLIAGALSVFGGVSLHLSSGFFSVGSGDIVCSVSAVSRLDRLTLPRSVLVLADQTAPRSLELDDGVIVLSGADNRRMRRTLNGHLNPVVTCGTGQRDTLTISSVTAERAILCAQRELPTVSGLWLEPAEFAVGLKRCTIGDAMLAAGTAALCGFDLSDRWVTIG